MAWPIIASTRTTLSVFFPLLFWTLPSANSLKFLQITVILDPTASLFMALVFIPVVLAIDRQEGPRNRRQRKQAAILRARKRDPVRLGGGWFHWATSVCCNSRSLLPGVFFFPFFGQKTLIMAVTFLLASFGAYGQFG